MILVLFSIITALASAFLDIVTTILLIAPVTFVITETLKINPYPFIVVEVLMANVGGTATLIGDPPNIMIGSANGIGFLEFITNLGPVVVVISFVTLLIIKFTVGNKLHVTEENKKKVMGMDDTNVIRDHKLLMKSVVVLCATVLGFIFHGFLHLESATVALSGAAILLFISGSDPEEIFMDIEWTTIFFFISLFILVGGLEEAGIIELFAQVILGATHGNLVMTLLVLLWGSALLSSFLDNIPFVATMIPLIQSVGELSGMDITPLWWALALGACLGGNGTMIGASANVVACGMLEKKNHKVNFVEYMKFAFPLMIVSIVISTIYLVLFYA
jgi:Na+/H+ antiporter NhaD/arsenite permease-like protein